MPSDLARFGLTEMLRCSMEVRRASAGARSMEAAATRVCRFLYDEFVGTEQGGAPMRQCALVRCYKTHPFGALDTGLKAFARDLLAGAPERDDLRCLTLLATVGDEPAWNSRLRSRAHRAIPLATAAMIEQAPMIAQLLRQFGLEPAKLVAPSSGIVGDLQGKTYGVFHVENALGSPYIPAQREFVIPYGVRSVVGFGGSLRTGDLFAIILFSRTPVTRDVADRFRSLALDVKTALFDFADDEVFGAGDA